MTIDDATLRRKCFAIINDAGLGDDDRRDLAGFVLGRDVESFTHLTPEEWMRVADAMTGWFAVEQLRRDRGLVGRLVDESSFYRQRIHDLSRALPPDLLAKCKTWDDWQSITDRQARAAIKKLEAAHEEGAT